MIGVLQLKHVIIGTAGHVDHGKTSLVKALTGIDTDRLEEEKRRGVTIEPGFAYIDLENGTRAGIIDVPGHERFIRNMLAGSGGVDLAMLVVAADEGVMPQTREHLGILIHLGISDGLVVITKSEKAEPDWLELVIDDVTALVSGTFLDSKPVIPVSAFTGSGLPELKKALREVVDKAQEKDINLPFRLPVDRVFPIDGFGIIATGTLIEGSVKTGDVAEILPSGETAPVRGIQVHGENAETAYAGQRTAISLAGIKRGNIKRGDVITSPGALNVTNTIDVKLSILPDSTRSIKSGSLLHLYHGARTMLAKAFLFGCSELHHGESCYARLKLKEPLPCKRNDRFVLRFYSPLETIGGGIILDSQPNSRIPRSKSAIEALKTRELGNAVDITGLAAFELGNLFSESDLCRRADIDENTCRETIGILTANGSIIKMSQDCYISSKTLEILSNNCKRLLEEYHKLYPLRSGMNIAELRQKLMPDTGTNEANAVLSTLKDNRIVNISDNIAALTGFTIVLSPLQQKIHDKLFAAFTSAGYETPAPDELSLMFPKNEKRDFDQVLEIMISNGDLVMLSPQIFWSKSNYDKAVTLIREHFSSNKEITLAQCRDMLGTSRKYALAFLEYLDKKQATRMRGDAREIAKGF